MALALCAFASASAAAATEVSNTARLDFLEGPTPRAVMSNTVSVRIAPASTPGVVTFRRAPTGASGLSVDGGQCRTADGQYAALGAPRPAAIAATTGVAASATPPRTSVYHAGDPVLVTLADADRNRDPAVRETIDLGLTTSIGDEEQLRLIETGVDTGVFAAIIASAAVPPDPIRFNCVISVRQGVRIEAEYRDAHHASDMSNALALVDPYGFVIASDTAEPVDGARVTLIDTATGRPAQVFGDDGVSAYPSSVVSGGAATDASGAAYDFPAGAFRFPLVATGGYRLLVEPPVGFVAPSQATSQALGAFRDPAGATLAIQDGSYGRPFQVLGPLPLKVDIPLDRLRANLVLEKTASVATASSGDFIQYRLTLTNRDPETAAHGVVTLDTLPVGLRYRSGSLRRDGVKVADPGFAVDGRTFTADVGALAAGASAALTYVVQVDGSARYGDAINRARAEAAGRLVSNEAQAGVRITAPLFTDALTIVGRVTRGACGVATREGVAGVRIVLDTGAYVVTDADGQYHFEAVRPGTHVVQLDEASLPAGATPASCALNTRSAGRPFSQFVEAEGGGLWRADFNLAPAPAEPAADAAVALSTAVGVASDAEAAGGARDWLADAAPGVAWLFPSADHNPRAPTVRAVIKHGPDQTVSLTVNGQPAGALTFDGTQTGRGGQVAVSIWRGLPLRDGDTVLAAEVKDAQGAVVERLTRTVHYANAPARAELAAERSRLIADGRTRPVIAVRLLDRAGRPLRAGTTGTVGIGAPYTAALELDAQQQRQLSGLSASAPAWKVAGDDGVALIELAPTAQSGRVTLSFEFDREGVRTRQELTAWLTADREEWIVVGFAKGTLAHGTLGRHAEADDDGGELLTDGQVSLYAKGRVLGRWLLTLAYDSDKQEDGDRRAGLLSTIDPGRYYMLYGDGSEQGFDAASQSKLYLRLERGQFYALFGDFETGLTETELSRYSRTLHGVKTEFQGRVVSFNAFAADTGQRFAREEIQGSGLSGLYRLGRRDIVLNSDKVRLETRDRFRSERIVASEALARHLDYDIDYALGTLTFRRPVLSRDADLNPVFVVVEYETRGSTDRALNGGGRVAATLQGGKVELGASYVRDADGRAATDLAGLDVTLRPREDTEVRIEVARSEGSGEGARPSGTAFLAEVEHQGERVDALAYLRQQDAGFGVGQQNGAEVGTRKFGVDGRYRLGQSFSLVGAAWREESLTTGAQRDAGEARLEYRTESGSLRLGTQLATDRVGDRTLSSRLLTLGASRSLMDRKLELDAQTSFSLGGEDAAVDFPARYRLGASYALRDDVRLLISHEITEGEAFDSTSTRLGIDAEPWSGARFAGALNNDVAGENTGRVFANLGLSQSFVVSEHLSLDVAADSSTTFDGEPTSRDGLNPAHPIAAGGHLGGGGLSEDFYALSAGATVRTDVWAGNVRIEGRDGAESDQLGLAANVLRQTRSGVALAGALRVYETRGEADAISRLGALDLSAAYRPLGSRWSILEKLELQYDAVDNAGAVTAPGLFDGAGPEPGGSAQSRRIINNVVLNRAGEDDDGAVSVDFLRRSQVSLYYGAKYVFTQFDRDDYAGFTDIVRLELRHDLTRRIDIGLHGGALHAWEAGTLSYTAGVSVGVSPVENAWISLGWNLVGFDDPDFDDAGYTRQGPYVTARFKFDQDTPDDVARLLGRRR